jgi:hypothetical protein
MIGFFFDQAVNAGPVILDRLLDAFFGVVLQAQAGGDLDEIEGQQFIQLITARARDLFVGARLDDAVAEAG